MPKRFTDLVELNTPAVNDVVAIVDVSENATKRITLLNLLTNMVDTIALKDLAVTAAKLAASAVTTTKIANNAVTAAKIESQQAWQTPTLINSWVNYGSPFANAGYMKDSLGFVHLRGLIKSGAFTTAFNLPAGYRPGSQQIYVQVADAVMTRIDIYANGDVNRTLGGSNPTGYMSLEGITFKAEN